MKAELGERLGELSLGLVVELVEGGVCGGAAVVDAGALDGEDGGVEVALGRAEAAVDGPGAGDVGDVAGVEAAGVGEEEVARAEEGVVADVVDAEGVGAAGGDGLEGGGGAAVEVELVGEEGGEVGFVGEGVAHGFGEGSARGSAGDAHVLDFGGAFLHAEVVHDGVEGLEFCGFDQFGEALGAFGGAAAEEIEEGGGVAGRGGDVGVDV